MTEFSTIHVVVGVLIFLAGLAARFGFDMLGRWTGWAREDRQRQDDRIDAVDQDARSSIERVERELGNKVSALDRKVGVLDERVKHLPTSDDIEEVNRRLSSLEREVGEALATITGQSEMVRTIRDHIMRVER